MNYRKQLFSTLLFCFGGVAAYSQSSPIVVEIKSAQTTIQNSETFTVNTSIRNIGSDEEWLSIWSCSYPQQWQADNPFVHVDGVGCKKNDIRKIRIKSGGVYERPLSIRVEFAKDSSQTESVTFRLGFQPEVYGTAPKNPPIWSNAVTVSVTR
jgi:hypothetical protein